MKRLMISGFAAVALLAMATPMLWSRSHSAGHPGPVAAATPLQAAAGTKDLATEEFEDMSLVYSTAPKH
jgi:hypothetical protein